MTIQKQTLNGCSVAIASGKDLVLTDTASALDLICTVRHEAECTRVAISKDAVCEDFFILSTGLAGEVLQKFINYGVKIAIYGDYSRYTSKPLKDFIRESNRGNNIFFAPTLREAVEWLARAK